MGAIWTDQKKYETWLAIEIYACEAWAKKGAIPKEALDVIGKKATFDIARIEEIEKEVSAT